MKSNGTECKPHFRDVLRLVTMPRNPLGLVAGDVLVGAGIPWPKDTKNYQARCEKVYQKFQSVRRRGFQIKDHARGTFALFNTGVTHGVGTDVRLVLFLVPIIPLTFFLAPNQPDLREETKAAGSGTSA